ASVAVGAWALDNEQPLMRADLAAPGAQVAAAGAGAFRRARAVTGLAGDRDFDLGLRVLAVERVVEADLQVVAQVRAASRALPLAAAERAAEDGLENVAEVGEVGALPAPRAHPLLERGVAEAVIGGALLRILEALIRLAD